MKRVGFIFPGQGSQKVGMGEAFINEDESSKDFFNQADRILNTALTDLILHGPEQTLTETKYAQPALLLISTIIYEKLKAEGVQPSFVAGHSLGEYSALVAAGVLDFDSALKLVYERGKLMEQADPDGQGGMAAVLGLDQEAIKLTLSEIEACVEIANLNCPGQIVISGTKAGIDQATVRLKEQGAKRVIPLNVSGPFHSSLMEQASQQLANLLDQVDFNQAEVPVYANVTAEKTKDATELKQLLVKQLYSPVRFHEIIVKLLEEDLDALVEVGNGKVLAGLVKKVSRKAKVFSIQDPDSFSEFMAWYKGEDQDE